MSLWVNMRQTRLSRSIQYFTEYSKNIATHVKFDITKKAPSFPYDFQIQTINSCNGSCIMCPNSRYKKRKSEYMSDELFNKILAEIVQEKNSTTTMALFLQNEPLLDENIDNKIKYIKLKSCSRIKTLLTTNGKMLSNENITKIGDAGLDEISISLDAFREETYKKIRRGDDFQSICKNIDNLLESNYDFNISVRFVLQKDNASEIQEFIEYWHKRGVRTIVSQINNRSGDLQNYDALQFNREDISVDDGLRKGFWGKIIRCCPKVLTTMNILWNGDVILCCSDYQKKLILGNIKNTTIKRIWNSNKYQEIRRLLYYKQYKKIPVCRECKGYWK